MRKQYTKGQTKKRINRHALLFILSVVCLGSSLRAQERDEKPNVIIILTDDQGYKDVGFNGCTDIPTPNLDRIAANGVKFTSAYVSYAVCGPSRAGLITGRYQDRFGFGRNPLLAPNDPNMGLPRSEQTLASYLDQSGYATLALGKWHLGAHESLHPLERGFDDFYGYLSGGHHYFPELWTLQDLSEITSQFDGYKTKLLRNHTRVDETEYLTDALSREAVSYIEKKSKEPFFIYLAYNAPHTPLQATEKYLKRFVHIKDEKRRTYAAMISAVDDGVGIVLEKLEEKGLTKNTIVIYLSDNGGPKHNGSDNSPLRGHKGNYFEGGIRVPFAIQWPDKIKAGSTYEKPIISLDIFATIAAQCTPGIRPKNQLDGVDLIPYLNGSITKAPHEYLFWRNYDRKGKAVRNADYKMIVDSKVDPGLYNVTEDIGETTNLKSENPEGFTKLTKAWQAWEATVKEPVFLGLRRGKEYDKLHPDRYDIKKK